MKQAEIMNNPEQIRAGLEKLLEYIERSTNQKPLDEARRNCWRYAWPAPAVVKLVETDDSEESSEPLYSTAHNISAEGMDFYSPRELEMSTKVVVTLETEDGHLSIPATVLNSISSVGKPLVSITLTASMVSGRALM